MGIQTASDASGLGRWRRNPNPEIISVSGGGDPGRQGSRPSLVFFVAAGSCCSEFTIGPRAPSAGRLHPSRGDHGLVVPEMNPLRLFVFQAVRRPWRLRRRWDFCSACLARREISGRDSSVPIPLLPDHQVRDRKTPCGDQRMPALPPRERVTVDLFSVSMSAGARHGQTRGSTPSLLLHHLMSAVFYFASVPDQRVRQNSNFLR